MMIFLRVRVCICRIRLFSHWRAQILETCGWLVKFIDPSLARKSITRHSLAQICHMSKYAIQGKNGCPLKMNLEYIAILWFFGSLYHCDHP